jgi:chromosome segregation ATPase
MFNEINEKLELLKNVNDKIGDLQKNFSIIQKELNSYKDKVNKLEEKVNEKNSKIQKLENKILQIEQHSRKQNAEIIGLEQQDHENLHDIFDEICNKMQIKGINKNDIDVIHRIPNKKKTPENVIIRFKHRNTRDNFINQKKKQISNKDIYNNKNENRIYIVENQTKEFKTLFWEVKQKAIQGGYIYIWSKDGNIYIKKSETDKKIKIKSVEDIPI